MCYSDRGDGYRTACLHPSKRFSSGEEVERLSHIVLASELLGDEATGEKLGKNQILQSLLSCVMEPHELYSQEN